MNSTPRPLYPLYKELGGTQANLDGCRKSRPAPGLAPWTVQALASRHNKDAIPVHKLGESERNVFLDDTVQSGINSTPIRGNGLFQSSGSVQQITARINDVKFQKTLSFTEEPQTSQDRTS